MRMLKQACLTSALLVCALALLGLLSLQRLPAQRGGGGGVASRAGDVNCDGNVDISDPVHLLNFLFGGGREPCAAAQNGGDCCPEIAAKLDRMLAVLEDPCRDPTMRFTNNGDRTVTDHCTGLQWLAFRLAADVDLDGAADDKFNVNQATSLALQNRTGGHADWRLPTAREMEALMAYATGSPFNGTAFPEFERSFNMNDQNTHYWTGTDELREPGFSGELQVFAVHFQGKNIFSYPRTEKLAAILVRGPVE